MLASTCQDAVVVVQSRNSVTIFYRDNCFVCRGW